MTKPGQRISRNAARLRVTNGHRAGVCGLMLVGLTFREACRVMGVPTLPMRKLLGIDWTGRQKEQRKRRWKGEELKDLEEAYRDRSLSLTSISQLFGTHQGNISTMAKQYGWPSRRVVVIKKMTPDRQKVYRKLRRDFGRDEALHEALR